MPADHDNHDVPPFDKDFWEALSRRAETIRNLPVDELPTSDELVDDDLDVDPDVLLAKEGFWEGVYRRADAIRNLPVDELPTSDELVDDGDEPLTLVPYKPTLCSFEDAGEFLPTTVPGYGEVELVLLELALSWTEDHTLVGPVYATSHELSEHAESVPQVRIGWEQQRRDQDDPAHDAPLESRRWVRWMSADEHESLTLFVVGQASALIADALGSAEPIVDEGVAATLQRHGFDAYVAFRHGLLGRALGALSVLDEPDAPPAFASREAWTTCYTDAIYRRCVRGLQLGDAESSPRSAATPPTGRGASTWEGRVIKATRRGHDPTGWAGRYLQGRASEHVFLLNWLRESGELVLADRGSGKSCFLHHLWWVQSLEDAAVPAPEVVSAVSAERDTSQGAKPEPHSDFVVVLDNLDELHADATLLRQLRWIIPGFSPRGPGQGICNQQNLLATLSMAVFTTCSRDNRETPSVEVLDESGSQLVPVSRSDTAIEHPHMYAQIMCLLRQLNDALACSDPGQEDLHSALPNTGGVLFWEHVDKEHLVEWDCWGPVVHYNIVERGDVGDRDGCTIEGGICMGGTMPDFPDQFIDRRSLGPASRGTQPPDFLPHVVHRDRVER